MVLEELKWEDLVSPTMTPNDYLEKFGKKNDSTDKTYEPKLRILEKINCILKEKNQKLRILVLGAEWCPDCNVNVPRMIKIVKLMKNEAIIFKILYGIMVDGFHKSGLKIWHKTRSPPEALNPKFNLEKIPTFYFFNKEGRLLGIIVENPKTSSTLEEDLLEILENKL